MIGKANRFHGYGSLRYVYQQGQTVRGPLMTLRYSKNTKRQTYRLAVVVSKKVDKSAVARNRIRRRIYEAVRVNADIQEAFDLVIIVQQVKVKDLAPPDLTKQLTDLLRQAGIAGAREERDMIEPKET